MAGTPERALRRPSPRASVGLVLMGWGASLVTPSRLKPKDLVRPPVRRRGQAAEIEPQVSPLPRAARHGPALVPTAVARVPETEPAARGCRHSPDRLNRRGRSGRRTRERRNARAALRRRQRHRRLIPGEKRLQARGRCQVFAVSQSLLEVAARFDGRAETVGRNPIEACARATPKPRTADGSNPPRADTAQVDATTSRNPRRILVVAAARAQDQRQRHDADLRHVGAMIETWQPDAAAAARRAARSSSDPAT